LSITEWLSINPAPFAFFGFFCLWALIIKMVSLAGGWTKLAAYYQSDKQFPAKIYRCQYGRMKAGVQYKSSLDVGMDASGLYLRQFIFFRLFHKPLFIPWGHINPKRIENRLFKGARLEFPRVPGVYLDIVTSLFHEMTPYLKKYHH